MTARVLIGDELAEFLQSGLAIAVATRDDLLAPDGAWGWALRVEEDGTHVSVYLYEEAARAMLVNLEKHPEIAVVLDRPTTHRACQLKGTFVGARTADESERSEVRRQVDDFRADLEAIGIPKVMTAGWSYWPSIALRIAVAQVFDQTPGPGTGEPLP